MRFRIDADKFMRYVKPAVDVALKNIKKDEFRKPFKYAGSITIEASPDDLLLKANGGSASIVVRVNTADGYIPDVNGVETIRASEVMECLKSFQPTDKLIVSTDGGQVIVALEADEEICIKTPTLSYIIKCYKIPKQSDQECVVSRAYFVKGLQKVAYAMADEEKMSTYMCLLFESWKNRMMFTAGSGGRFARLDIDIDCHQISDDETFIIFPKTNVSNVIRVFKDSDHTNIKIRTIEESLSQSIPAQVVLENSSITMALYGVEQFTKYPNIRKIINGNYSYSIATRIRDWKPVIEAIKATYHSNDSSIHNTEVVADLIEGNFLVRTNTIMQISRKVPFEFGAYAADYSKGKNSKPWFRCNSKHLMEMVQKGGKDGTVIVNFDDQAKLAEIPEDKPKNMKPVLITCPITTNKDGTKERYCVFFTVSTKW